MTTRRARAEADLDDLIPTFVATPADIHLAEQANLESAAMWAFGPRCVVSPERLFTTEFSDRLHCRMFDDVWRSAGKWRHRPTTFGVAPREIGARLEELFDGLRVRRERSVGSPSDSAIRLHNGLLEIGAYHHGNGRHARLMADLSLHIVGAQRITWSELPGEADLHVDATRRANTFALQSALDQTSQTDPNRLQSALDRALKSRQ